MIENFNACSSFNFIVRQKFYSTCSIVLSIYHLIRRKKFHNTQILLCWRLRIELAYSMTSPRKSIYFFDIFIFEMESTGKAKWKKFCEIYTFLHKWRSYRAFTFSVGHSFLNFENSWIFMEHYLASVTSRMIFCH